KEKIPPNERERDGPANPGPGDACQQIFLAQDKHTTGLRREFTFVHAQSTNGGRYSFRANTWRGTMGRRKVEMKRIEDKSSRQVTFSKRRGGLMKKARELSVLCGVDVGVVVFSCSGKLYDFCSGTDRSVQIVFHQPTMVVFALLTTQTKSHFTALNDYGFQVNPLRYKSCCQPEGKDTGVHEAETQLMMDSIVTLNEEEEKTRAENEFLKHQILTMQKDINRNELPRNHSCPKHTALYFLG
ncbi:hypothetical protein RJ640_030871, partial [Escallonia rubra]